MAQPKISVIIPCYNAEDSVGETIESVINQSIGFENLEIIIVDDCSTDSTRSIINEFSDKHENILGIFCEENNGSPGIPRNIGMENANGDYIMFLDSDDNYREDMCEHLYNIIISENVDFVGCRYSINGKEKNRNFLDNYGEVIKVKTINDFPEIMYTTANCTIWNKIYKKSFLDKKNIKFLETWNEDLFFSINVFLEAEGFVLLNDFIGLDYVFDLDKERNLSPSKKVVTESLYGLNKSLNAILNKNLDYITALYEPLVHWVLLFSKADSITKIEKKEIYDKSKCLLKCFKFKFNTKIVNLNYFYNILVNILMKLFYSNFQVAYLLSKLLKHM